MSALSAVANAPPARARGEAPEFARQKTPTAPVTAPDSLSDASLFPPWIRATLSPAAPLPDALSMANTAAGKRHARPAVGEDAATVSRRPAVRDRAVGKRQGRALSEIDRAASGAELHRPFSRPAAVEQTLGHRRRAAHDRHGGRAAVRAGQVQEGHVLHGGRPALDPNHRIAVVSAGRAVERQVLHPQGRAVRHDEPRAGLGRQYRKALVRLATDRQRAGDCSQARQRQPDDVADDELWRVPGISSRNRLVYQLQGLVEPRAVRVAPEESTK